MKTKSKIISKAIKRFNESGYGAINLFDLAQSLNMSRGNLTYHFKDKESLLQVIVKDMFDKMEVERKKAQQFPSFENLHNEVQLYYKFQKKYAFIFLDSHVLKMPFVNKLFKAMTKQYVADNNAAIAFAVNMGNMKPEPVPGIYNNIAVTSWMLAFYWSSQKIIRGEMKAEDGEKMIWSLLVPHFTEKGVKAFIKFFGKKYYNNLGKPFNMDMAALVSF